jgi:hypothetical protein
MFSLLLSEKRPFFAACLAPAIYSLGSLSESKPFSASCAGQQETFSESSREDFRDSRKSKGLATNRPGLANPIDQR